MRYGMEDQNGVRVDLNASLEGSLNSEVCAYFADELTRAIEAGAVDMEEEDLLAFLLGLEYELVQK
jgi:hypothetical protein